MHTNEIKQAIKNDDFLTFRKLLKTINLNDIDKQELIKSVHSHILPPSQKTYIDALKNKKSGLGARVKKLVFFRIFHI